MIAPEKFVGSLQQRGISFFTGVPDSLLKDLCAYFEERLDPANHVIAANEGNAVALAGGHFLATGKPAAVYMQNSGLGNAVNPLLSLADPEVYAIPMVLLIGWRGEPNVKDEPQHVKQGRITVPMLESMEIPSWVVDKNSKYAAIISDAYQSMQSRSAPVALVIRAGTFEAYSIAKRPPKPYPLLREAALQRIIDRLPPDTIVVSSTGHISRELYEYRLNRGANGQTDFLTVGCMGHASSIALGMALAQPDRLVACLDGDGAALMHLGALTTVGSLSPKNLVHIVLNNGAHESVGAQPTVGLDCDLEKMALAGGYPHAISVETADQIDAAIAQAVERRELSLIEVRVRLGARKDLLRPKTTPLENRRALMTYLGSAG